METISNILFWISNGLLVPVIVLLLLFLGRALLLAAGFFGEFHRRKTILSQTAFIESADAEEVVNGVNNLSASSSSTVGSSYMKALNALGSNSTNAPFCERVVANYEVDAAKELSGSRILVKLGPMLGLMGTLIPMGPALVGLATGDISAMAYNMQVAFATTVVGMVIAAIGVATLQVRQRWYARELNNLEYVRQLLTHVNPERKPKDDEK